VSLGTLEGVTACESVGSIVRYAFGIPVGLPLWPTKDSEDGVDEV
jgi:hypothetical protein